MNGRGPPHGQRGRRHTSTVAVVVYSSTVIHHISRAAARAKHVGRFMGRMDVVGVVAVVVAAAAAPAAAAAVPAPAAASAAAK